jgi:hypothetical protein
VNKQTPIEIDYDAYKEWYDHKPGVKGVWLLEPGQQVCQDGEPVFQNGIEYIPVRWGGCFMTHMPIQFKRGAQS